LAYLLKPKGVWQLLQCVLDQGYSRLVAPQIKNTLFIDFVPLEDRPGLTLGDRLADWPLGWEDEQEGGVYRLRRTDSPRLFGIRNTQQSLRNYFQAPVKKLGSHNTSERAVFIGVRPCDVKAALIQDRVLKRDDASYLSARNNAFIISVNCHEPVATCFCASQGAGPRATEGFDISFTEFVENGVHELLLEVGSEQGERVVNKLNLPVAGPDYLHRVERQAEACTAKMTRKLDNAGIRDMIYANLEHPRWELVGQRCLTCANCTMVCPTCFCNTIETSRTVRWDSCYTLGFSFLHGKPVRRSNKARYRQWLQHKLASWWDQYGCSGCVGCGRCITWCPVGIDLTEEVSALKQRESA
jgi:ferredoxin